MACRAAGVQVSLLLNDDLIGHLISQRQRRQTVLPYITAGYSNNWASPSRAPQLRQPPSCYRSSADVWLHQLSRDEPHETFLTFLKCVANQEWPLMCGGFSNWLEMGTRKKKRGSRGWEGHVEPDCWITLWRYNIQLCKWNVTDLCIFPKFVGRLRHCRFMKNQSGWVKKWRLSTDGMCSVSVRLRHLQRWCFF